MTFFKKIRTNISILWHSLFRGLAAADAVMESQGSVGADGSEIVQQKSGGGVFADMLQEKVTKEAEETRDKNYRILREADKYDTSSIKMSVDENGEVTFTGTSSRLKKKTKADFIKHPPVYEEEGTRLRTIQDNKTFKTKQTLYGGANAQFAEEDMSHMYNNLDFDTTLTVTRDFIPRIPIDKFITKMVVRITESEERSFVDLYLPTKAGQFSKLDAIMVGNIYQMWETGNLKSDITEFKTIEWYSEKAWNSEDLCLFKYDDPKLVKISIFDGSFVLTYDCHVIDEGTDIVAKYKTKELDERYEANAPKKASTDIFAIMNHEKVKKETDTTEIDLSDLGTTTLKLS